MPENTHAVVKSQQHTPEKRKQIFDLPQQVEPQNYLQCDVGEEEHSSYIKKELQNALLLSQKLAINSCQQTGG